MGSNLENEQDDRSEDEGREARAILSPSRLIEGVRDYLLLQLKQAHMQKPWPQMSEKDQRIWITRVEERAERLVGDVVDYVTAGDFPVVHAKVDTFQIKAGEVKIVAKGFADDEVLLTLNHAGQKAVKIIVADADQFDQARDPLNPDPDQPGLPGVKLSDDEPGFEDGDEDQDPPETDEGGNPEGEQEAGAEALKPKSDEWRGGFNSRMGRHYRNENPFNPSSQTQAFTDWHEGWDAADFDDKAPKLGKPSGEVERAAEETVEDRPSKHYVEGMQARESGADELANPYSRNPMKKDWAEGWAAGTAPAATEEREPDAEVEEPAVEPDDDGIPNQDGEIIETDEQAYEYGKWCRADGRGTGSNPFPPGSDLGKAWLRGYSDQRKAEEF